MAKSPRAGEGDGGETGQGKGPYSERGRSLVTMMAGKDGGKIALVEFVTAEEASDFVAQMDRTFLAGRPVRCVFVCVLARQTLA